MMEKTEDVLDWFLDLPPEVRRRVLHSPTLLSPREIEKRAKLAEWFDRVMPDDDVDAAAQMLVDRGFGEDETDEVVRTMAELDLGTRAEEVAEDRNRIFEMVGREVLESYTGDEPEAEARQEFDVEDTADLRLRLSRTVAAVSCGDIDLNQARRRVARSGASEESVDEFVDELASRLDDVNLHLRRVRVESLSEEIRSLRWDSLTR